MLYYRKIVVIITFTLFCFCQDASGQTIDVNDYENKAQAYAILSAQYSKEAYYYSRQNFFESSTKLIKANSDTGLVYTQVAMEYADSALLVAHDSSIYAKSVMLIAKKYQEQSGSYFKQIAKEMDQNRLHELVGNSMYAAGNALTDAYKASLFFDWKQEQQQEKDEIDEPKEKRDVTRLESDEFSFMTIKEMYGKRLIEIEDEILLLEAAAKKSSGVDLEKINNAISQLKKEEKDLIYKMKNSEDKLIKVKNDLNAQMLSVVNKDFFTTEKEKFYNDSVPVPVNFEMPKGLVYRVQIGFFKSQLPQDHFDGIFPISSEKIDQSYYRYTAGNFKKYEEAKEAKITISKKGYTDAFVVAYIDGKKVPISQALNEEKKLK
ncbi:MAG: hypothetical protein J5I47_04070 [Vicingus serpentipes]|nr:hypothetical protein [Vicingus serpentipes]